MRAFDMWKKLDRKIKKFLVFTLSLSLTMALIVFIVDAGDFKYYKQSENFSMYQSTEPVYQRMTFENTGPNYFFPLAEVKVSITNPNAKQIQGFKFELSLDNESWVEIPLKESVEYTSIGTIFSDSSNKIYVKTVFPAQNSAILDENNFQYSLKWTRVWTPQSTIITIILGIALFSFVLKIFEFFILDE